jgi:hypothetical protein
MAPIMAALAPLLLKPSVAEVQFQVVIFLRGIYSNDLCRSPIEPFVVVSLLFTSGGSSRHALLSVFTVR